jgi:hypothetical protein
MTDDDDGNESEPVDPAHLVPPRKWRPGAFDSEAIWREAVTNLATHSAADVPAKSLADALGLPLDGRLKRRLNCLVTEDRVIDECYIRDYLAPRPPTRSADAAARATEPPTRAAGATLSTRRRIQPDSAMVRDPAPTPPWIDELGARFIGQHPFAARQRKHPELGRPIEVAHIQFAFRQWDGPIANRLEVDMRKGKGLLYSLDSAEMSCNEVEVAKRLKQREVRDHAFWFSGFQPGRAPQAWRASMRNLATDAPAWLIGLDAEIRALIPSKRGGMPDVVAWNDVDGLRSAIFVECKGPGEWTLEAQEDWVWAAQQVGVLPEQIAVSQRPF